MFVFYYSFRAMPPLEVGVVAGNASDICNRFAFNTRFQKQDETIDNFAASLVMLSSRCQYSADQEHINTLIRDQFIVGISDKRIQTKLLDSNEPNLKFEDAIKLAQDSASGHNDVKSELEFKHTDDDDWLMEELQSGPSNYQCQFCDKSYLHNSNLTKHMKSNHPDLTEGRTWKCDVCPFDSFSRLGIIMHKRLKHKSYICKICSEICRSFPNFVQHANEKHPNQCPLCEEKNPGDIQEHLNSFHFNSDDTKQDGEDEDETHDCKHCDSKFKQVRNLIRHYKTHHFDVQVEGRLSCLHCKEAFFSERGVKKHYKALHSELGKPAISSALSEILKDIIAAKVASAEDKGQKLDAKLVCDIDSSKFRCEFCAASFKHVRNLMRHYRLNHADKDMQGKINCPVCNDVFFSERGLNKHLSTLHPEHMMDRSLEAVNQHLFGRFECKFCPSTFKLKKNLDNHYKKAHSDVEIEGRLNCKHCNEVFFSVMSLRQHYTRQHLDPNNMNDIIELETIHHQQGDYKAQNVEQKSDLKDKKSETSEKSSESAKKTEEPGLCDICGNVFANPTQHFLNVHAKDRQYKCHLCTFSHPKKGRLAHHIRNTHMEPKFVCEICGQKRRSAVALRTHIAQVHEGQRPWPCPVCNKTFASRHYVDEHVKVQHEKVMPFSCNQCHEKFARRRTLIMHRRTVHENKWFDCHLCGKRFKEKCAVENHVKLVHENKYRYSCKMCGVGFRSDKPYRDHLTNEHGIQQKKRWT